MSTWMCQFNYIGIVWLYINWTLFDTTLMNNEHTTVRRIYRFQIYLAASSFSLKVFAVYSSIHKYFLQFLEEEFFPRSQCQQSFIIKLVMIRFILSDFLSSFNLVNWSFIFNKWSYFVSANSTLYNIVSKVGG